MCRDTVHDSSKKRVFGRDIHQWERQCREKGLAPPIRQYPDNTATEWSREHEQWRSPTSECTTPCARPTSCRGTCMGIKKNLQPPAPAEQPPLQPASAAGTLRRARCTRPASRCKPAAPRAAPCGAHGPPPHRPVHSAGSAAQTEASSTSALGPPYNDSVGCFTEQEPAAKTTSLGVGACRQGGMPREQSTPAGRAGHEHGHDAVGDQGHGPKTLLSNSLHLVASLEGGHTCRASAAMSAAMTRSARARSTSAARRSLGVLCRFTIASLPPAALTCFSPGANPSGSCSSWAFTACATHGDPRLLLDSH